MPLQIIDPQCRQPGRLAEGSVGSQGADVELMSVVIVTVKRGGNSSIGNIQVSLQFYLSAEVKRCSSTSLVENVYKQDVQAI